MPCCHGYAITASLFGIGPEKIGTFQIVNFAKHQNPHKNEAVSENPSFSNGCNTTSEKSFDFRKIGTAP